MDPFWLVLVVLILILGAVEFACRWHH